MVQQMTNYGLMVSEAESKLLYRLYSVLSHRFEHIVEVFYEAIEANPEAVGIIENQEQAQRLEVTLRHWLETLFLGPRDDSYFRKRYEIGRTHVRVRMPQHLMIPAMNVIRTELDLALEESDVGDKLQARLAINKALDMDLGIMLESYRIHSVERIREAEQRGLRARLRENEQLATVGQLAASLAHEIKNPLAGIRGAIEIIGASLPEGNPHAEVIEEIISQVDRLDAAVKDLLVFARPTPPKLRPCRMDALVNRTIKLLGEEPALRCVAVHFNPGIDPITACVDETLVQQVLTNLVLNAAHASSTSTHVGSAVITIKLDEDTDLVYLTVADTGIGMPRDVLRRAFEPFYTTKSKGTGLGLSICKKIVEAHGGQIDVESAVGKGTRVKVVFPKQGQSANPDFEVEP